MDSLSALERVFSVRSFREFVLAISSFIKQREIAGLFTARTPTLSGCTSITDSHILTTTDKIFLLRYVELFGDMRHGMTVLKMGVSAHEKEIREFKIDHAGMHVGAPFHIVAGLRAGNPMQIGVSKSERVDNLFRECVDKQRLGPRYICQRTTPSGSDRDSRRERKSTTRPRPSRSRLWIIGQPPSR